MPAFPDAPPDRHVHPRALVRDAMAILPTGTLVEAKFRVLENLGRGGMGTVYAAEDVLLRRTVALKLSLHPAGSRTSLFEEAAHLARIRHDNVASVFGAGWHEEQPFLVMELVRGSDLATVIHEHYQVHREPMPIRAALRALVDVARGLAAVHATGLVHRDVKPANVVIESATGRTVLVDFGAVGLDGAVTSISGTPEYIAPEVVAGGARLAPAADLYALGVVAYELLTGLCPFAAGEIVEVFAKQRTHVPARVSRLRPEAASLDEIVERLLAKDPAARPTTAASVAATFEGLLRRLDAPRDTTERPSELPNAGALRVLVVDDDPVYRKLGQRAVEAALAGIPLSVAAAGSGTDALESIAQRAPDLVLLDYLLPDTNGIDLLARIRTHPKGKHARVIVLSGMVDGDVAWRFRSLGIDETISKPVDLDELAATVLQHAMALGWAVDGAAGGTTSPMTRRERASAHATAPASPRAKGP